jgi:hypothetical protein
MELPLRNIIFRWSAPLFPASSEGFCSTRRLCTACAWSNLLPGAMMSGLTMLS